MRLLIDNALSPLVAEGLRVAGYDAIHIRDKTSPAASDDVVLDLALSDDRVLISADTDFGDILAERQINKPSFVLLRPVPETINDQIAVLVSNLPQLETELERGVVAVIEGFRIRLRGLPIHDAQGPP